MRVYNSSRAEDAEKSIELHPLAMAIRDFAADFGSAPGRGHRPSCWPR